MSGRLIAHVGAEYIDREGLKALETPPATDTWTPIAHYDLVTALEGQLKARGIAIVKEQFAVQKAKLFGVLDTDYQVTDSKMTPMSHNACKISVEEAGRRCDRMLS